ncbi:hypothetical protein QQP08_025085 [Theobroma cacao]|nr:hypothetical protein QQP08_025085 [Theobroma cacao]
MWNSGRPKMDERMPCTEIVVATGNWQLATGNWQLADVLFIVHWVSQLSLEKELAAIYIAIGVPSP